MDVLRRFGRVFVTETTCKSVLNRVRGMPFAWSINPYQGCAHQCVFCYARSTHQYRALDGVSEWGTRLVAKVNAPLVLRSELAAPKWRGEHVAIGTATDPYQPLESRYRITRGILEELARARTPAHLITRSPLIVRDLDVLSSLARAANFHVCISLPTLDADLARRIEPTVASPQRRLETVRRLAGAGIEVGVAVAPVLPYLTDDATAIKQVVEAAADAGASTVWSSVLNLGDVARDAYFAFLEADAPELIDAHRALYRGRYATREYVRGAAETFRSAHRSVVFEPPPAIVPKPPRELTLL